MFTNNQFPPEKLQHSLSSTTSSGCNPFRFGGGGGSSSRRQKKKKNGGGGSFGSYSPTFPSSTNNKPKRMKTIDPTEETEEDMIARELSELTVAERERAYEDLHGVTTHVSEESTEFVTCKLHEMNVALDTNKNKFSAKNLRDYNRALFLWPELKTDRDFKLMFLRAEEYDGVKAAKRLVNYYKEKRVLFGDGKLVKKITIDDLSEEDIHVLKSGFSFELPQRDTSGRPILYCNTSKFDSTTMSVDSAVRACWYILMGAFTETKAAQLKGVCNIVQSPASTSDFMTLSKLAMRCGHNSNACLPGRITAFHSLYDSPDIGYWVIKYIPVSAGKYSRLRFRGHLGSDIEIEYELLAYGIRLGGLLHEVAQNDAGSKRIFYDYFARRTEIDRIYTQSELSKATESGTVPFPLTSDALFGRGRPYREWDGSRLWNRLVDKYASKYKSAETKFDKSLIAYHLLEDYKRSTESRFLLESISPQSSSSKQKGGGGRGAGAGGAGGGEEGTTFGWKILDLDGREAKQKAIYALQNRVKTLSSPQPRGAKTVAPNIAAPPTVVVI